MFSYTLNNTADLRSCCVCVMLHVFMSEVHTAFLEPGCLPLQSYR